MPDEFQTLKKERCIEIIKAYNGSGMPKRQWCREHGIGYSERLPRLGALPSFYACHTRTVSISWENSPFLIARDIGRFPLRYMIPIYKTVEKSRSQS